jgi:hypothetical protein
MPSDHLSWPASGAFRLLVVLAPGLALDAEAQTDTTTGKRDSLRVHELSEIVVHYLRNAGASMIGGVSVVQGVPPVEYGTNVLGGAVNLMSPSWAESRTQVEVAPAGGSEAQRQGAFAARGGAGAWRYGVSAGYATRDGLSLPDNAGIAYSQPDPGRRTNTDSRITNVSGRLVRQFAGGTEVGLSLFHLDAEKGVAPEGHKDPAVSTVGSGATPTGATRWGS